MLRFLGLLMLTCAMGCTGPGPTTSGDAGLDAGVDGGPDAASCVDCDDGLYCNGVERCEGGSCVAGDPPCEASACDEDADSCDTTCAEPDADGDGHASIACGGDDCDDEDGARYAGNVEVCDPDHHDEDCRPDTYGFADLDSDGYVDAACCNEQPDGSLLCGEDCNDMRAISHPNQVEACDGIDNDCDGEVDEGALRTFYPDADEDGFGDAGASAVEGCVPPAGHVENAGDCDDTNPHAHSASAAEVCDTFDNDCDGVADEDTSAVAWYLDTDMDLFGDASDPAPVVSCLPVPGRVTTGGDCDDSLPSVHPTAAEVCNEIDDDCDGGTDEGVGTTYYRDADRDGQGTATTTMVACAPPAGYVTRGDDCDDTQAGTHVGAPELCNRHDDDCSSGGGYDVSEDRDSDGHASPIAACSGGSPKDDCDDDTFAVEPGTLLYYTEPIRCGYGSGAGDTYLWCPASRCCVFEVRECEADARCDSVSRPEWDYDCSGSAEPEPWVTGGCEEHPYILGRCIGDGPVGSGTPPACGAPVSYRTCTRTGLTGPCTATISTGIMACH